jgi:hypothetical protein
MEAPGTPAKPQANQAGGHPTKAPGNPAKPQATKLVPLILGGQRA